MISHEHQAIFIHIPKTAGTSVEEKLGLHKERKRGDQDHRTIREVRPLSLHKHSRYLVGPEHLRIERLGRRNMLKEMLGLPIVPEKYGRRATKEEFSSYFKFTIVRNPWARIYSWYRNVMRDPLHGVPECDFSTFLYEYKNNWALRPQTYWITDFDKSIPLNRIVRFENIKEEMPDVLSSLGFVDCDLPHLLRGTHSFDYRTAYNRALTNLVAERYCDEISLLNYDF